MLERRRLLNEYARLLLDNLRCLDVIGFLTQLEPRLVNQLRCEINQRY